MARRKHSYRRAKAFTKRARRSKYGLGMGSPKQILKKMAIGTGAGVVTTVVLQKVGIQIPFADYVGAYLLGGTGGVIGKVAFDVLTSGQIPFLGGMGQSGGDLVV